jgi:hypothetical protein
MQDLSEGIVCPLRAVTPQKNEESPEMQEKQVN